MNRPALYQERCTAEDVMRNLEAANLKKKIGAESSDPNRHSQPRLPGSVVGEASMPRGCLTCKITKVTVP